MKSKIRALLATALLSLLATTAAQVRAEPAREFVLANGMKVVVKEDRRAPTAVQMVWYKVGSMTNSTAPRGSRMRWNT
jgi:zinc protease